MPIERIQIGSYEQWGKLVKTWATGRDYVNNGHHYLKPPQSITELQQQCAWAGVDMIVPDHYKDVQYATAGADTVLIRLPNPGLIADSEAILGGPGDTYMLPSFYKRIFQNVDPVISEADKMKVHAERIGDYSMNACM